MTEYIYSILKKYYGYDTFREGQEEVIINIMQGKDVLAIMPTGAGKSACYQIPAVAMSGITIVVSPLISLMKDQVATLNQMGIRAAYLNSSLSYKQFLMAIDNAKKGIYKIIYIAPERLLTDIFLEFAINSDISMVAIDEAHCISQWGHDFRPSYTTISQFINLLKQRPRVAAFTATATTQVKNDIIKQLSLENLFCLTTSFDRPNLYFSVVTPPDKADFIVKYLKKNPDKSGIIYCSTRKQVTMLSDILNNKNLDNTTYHAGLPDIDRSINQENFIYDRCKIIIATSAFGMGIDKSNVSFVIHYSMPLNLEAYYQEAGRAGRDGEKAECILLYHGADVRLNTFLIDKGIEKSNIQDKQFEENLKNREYEKLKYMTFYSTTKDCLRKFILKYFGENYQGKCNNCSSCVETEDESELSSDIKYILYTIKRVNEKYGASFIIDILLGNNDMRITKNGFDTLDEFSSLKNQSKSNLRKIIYWLEENEYIYTKEGEYPILKLTIKGKAIVKNISKVHIKSNMDDTSKYVDLQLFSKLKELRKFIADKQSVPAFVIFSDATLSELATYKPCDIQSLFKIKGIGQAKVEKYGKDFIDVIANYEN